MHQNRRPLKNKKRRVGLQWRGNRIVLLTLGLGLLLVAGSALAAEAAADQPRMKFPLAQMFTFLFLMLGPFKIIAPFSKITKGADAAVARRMAFQATVFASAALLVAGILGDRILSSYGIPLPILALSGGIILFLVALQTILQQFTSHGEESATSATIPIPSARSAMTPLAFPTIVTPYGIAALVVFLSFSPDVQTSLMIGVIVLAIMLLNLIVMLTARKILSVLGVVLPILGAVIGVVQVALGLQIINNSLRALGVL